MKEFIFDLEVLFLALLIVDLFIGFYLTIFRNIKDSFFDWLSNLIDKKIIDLELDKKADFSFFKNRAITNFTERFYTFFPFVHKPLLWIILYLACKNLKGYL
jgi:hypothetical protein